MGGKEETEPPCKRVRIPFEDSMETVGSKGVIRKSEFVKIITKALYSFGYNKSGALLEEESGIPLCPSLVNEFTEQIVDGKWGNSLATLRRIGLVDKHSLDAATFIILEHKFHEFLKTGDFDAALVTLRDELVPLGVNVARLRDLSACLIAPSIASQDTDVASSRLKLLEELQNLLPAAIVVPEKRLERLVEQALEVQLDACAFHNTAGNSLSLYSDHDCGRNQIPSHTLQILQAHSDEVWFLQFSHNGKYLASSSKDQTAILWEVKEDGRVSLRHVLRGHQKPVSVVSWSSDDRQLLTCGLEEAVRRWDVSSGTCLHVYEKSGVGLISCGWFADGQGIFSGMSDKSIGLWHLDGRELECWKGQRTLKISDMAVTEDGKNIISICRDTAIVLVDSEANLDRLVEEKEVITSFSLSKDNKLLLVNLINQEIHLWKIEGEVKVVAKYKGHKRARFVIRSCFGGFDQAFVASGSEDSQVYIWHRESGELITCLPGHSGAVNCVSWNPENLHMLASASDDRTIRIWGLKNRTNIPVAQNAMCTRSNRRT